MKVQKIILLAAVAISPLALSSCAAIGIGAGAYAGASAAQEGGLSRAMRDTRIQAEINDLWFKYSTDAFGKLDMTVNNGRVLITGVVQNPDHRVEAVRLAWQPKGVEQVINEIRVAESEGIKGFARDSWITTRLRASLVFNKEIQSLNYTIDTVQGTVYLMGVANSQDELDKAVEVARTIPDVKQVVSYVKVLVLEDGAQTPTTTAEAQ
ncbi:MAG: phospholipid-binding domain-containing protein [Alphaproteobacteria bacterium]|nr:phospholipid-binding domain-containing protein [Alphaproteobacteria bacterium]